MILTLRQLRKNGLFCDVLEIVKIGINHILAFLFDPSISIFITPQQNNLHTLSLKYCKLSSEATSSLIRSLQSSTLQTTQTVLLTALFALLTMNLLTTAIVSCTTITHLVFIDYVIDTPSLTALASVVSNRKDNGSAINHWLELAFDNYFYPKKFTKEQLQLLIEGVDSSAVKKLWLYIGYKELLSDCPLSRDDGSLSYNYFYDVYNRSTLNYFIR